MITEQMVLSEDSSSMALIESRGLPRISNSPGPNRFESAEASSFLTQSNLVTNEGTGTDERLSKEDESLTHRHRHESIGFTQESLKTKHKHDLSMIHQESSKSEFTNTANLAKSGESRGGLNHSFLSARISTYGA